jgi:hypothetical protein
MRYISSSHPSTTDRAVVAQVVAHLETLESTTANSKINCRCRRKRVAVVLISSRLYSKSVIVLVSDYNPREVNIGRLAGSYLCSDLEIHSIPSLASDDGVGWRICFQRGIRYTVLETVTPTAATAWLIASRTLVTASRTPSRAESMSHTMPRLSRMGLFIAPL